MVDLKVFRIKNKKIYIRYEIVAVGVIEIALLELREDTVLLK